MQLSVPSVSEARLASVLDTAVDGIILIDAQARILVFNKACERLFGYSTAEMVSQTIKPILPHEYAERYDLYPPDQFCRGLSKLGGIGRVVNGRHRDGTEYPLHLTAGELETPTGPQYVVFLRDLRPHTDADLRLDQLQSDLLHLARVSAMDEMGAAFAHELNQPLTALMVYLQAMKRASARDVAGDLAPPPHELLDKAVREAQRAGHIIQHMRRFVEKREPIRRYVDLNPLVEDAIELTLLGQRPGTGIVRSLAPDLPEVLVDSVQIQQVVVNLVRNALDAMAELEAPSSEVQTCQAGNWIEITVIDNGPGIPPTALPNLFKAFASSTGKGLGLGLAISRTIAQSHGGDLTVDPGGNGRGARFTLHLPLAESKVA